MRAVGCLGASFVWVDTSEPLMLFLSLRNFLKYHSKELVEKGAPRAVGAERPLALALAKTDMWEGHTGQTQANPFRFGIHSNSMTCLHVTVLSGIPGIW